MIDTEKRLVTFALFAYNQQDCVREGVQAAIAQSYQNLEVILSDDCSTDKTFEIMQEIASSYSGPHRLVLNRNDSNLGVAQHVNKVAGICSGELLIVAAGDDISRSDRVAAIVKAWGDSGYPEAALHSSARMFGVGVDPKAVLRKGTAADSACDLETFVSGGMKALINGATAAYTKGLFEYFGPITSAYEDVPLTFRAVLIGRLIYVDEPLIGYRVSQGQLSRFLTLNDRKRTGAWMRAMLSQIECHNTDYMTYCERQGVHPDTKFISEIDRQRNLLNRALGLASLNPFKWLSAMLVYPDNVTFRDRLYVYSRFFGLK